MNQSFGEKRLQKKLDKEAKRRRKIEEEAENLEKYGKQVARGIIQATIIELYEKGFVRVAHYRGLVGELVGDFEKLVGIDGSDGNVQKKSAGGRAAGALMTGGLNMLSSNIRGDLILTVVTDNQVHSISTQVGSSSTLEDIQTLVTAGKALLANRERAEKTAFTDANTGSLAGELEKLLELHKSGALSDDDFQRAKEKLLQ